ncbi:hypothetical protein BKA70DRAFT_1439449 [Coprinopsis sp. MPI-PUGE-AT-0042]|nr:hypothetical protein BKA70DRAFT_1439449 [Coprinopsis sp. MPI-PUGE-AT-0042]
MSWKFHDATLWKFIKRRAGLTLPFTRVNDGDEQVPALTPIETRHKSRDTVTGLAWARARRRLSMGARRSTRIRRPSSNRSLSSQKSACATGPSPLPLSLRVRQSRSSDFRQSGQVIILPPDATNTSSLPTSPVWGLDGIVHVNEVPRSSTHPPSPVYGLDGIMEAHASTRPYPSRITISFAQPRPLDQMIHEAESDPHPGEVIAPQADSHPEEGNNPSLSREIPATYPRLPLRRTLLTLSKKRRRRAKPVENTGYVFITVQDQHSTLFDAPSHSVKDDLPQENSCADQEPAFRAPSEPLPPLEPRPVQPAVHQTDGASSEPTSQDLTNGSRQVSSREANETSQRIVDWLQEVAQVASRRGSSCSPSASFASRDDYANTRSSTNKHRRSPANHSPPPPTPTPNPTSPTRPSSSETQVANMDGGYNVTFLGFQHDDDCEAGSRTSCEAQVNFSSVETEQFGPSSPAEVAQSRSGSSQRTFRSSPTIFDDTGDRPKRPPTVTPSTSRGTPSPSLPAAAPWDLDPTKSTITRVGDRWGASYLASRTHARQKHSKELEWKKHWRRRGDRDGGSMSKGTATKIYWTNYHVPTTIFDSHWQPPPGFQPSL